MDDKKVSSNKYFISDNWFLHKVVRGDDKLFHILMVSITHSKYVLQQVHDTFGHNGTARTYQFLK